MGFGGGTSPLVEFQVAVNRMFGQAQQTAAYDEAGRIRQQASITVDEAEQAAIARAREVAQFRSEQAHGYLSGGVLLQGSPLAVLDETRRLGQQEVDAIRRSGAAEANRLRLIADQTERGGLANLLATQSEGVLAQEGYREQVKQQKLSAIRGLVGLGGQIAAPFGGSLIKGGFSAIRGLSGGGSTPWGGSMKGSGGLFF